MNERVLNGSGVVRGLGDNIRTLNGGIGMNIFFPCESNKSKIIGRAGLLEGGPGFGNHFVNRAVTVIAVVCNWWGFGVVCCGRGVSGSVHCRVFAIGGSRSDGRVVGHRLRRNHCLGGNDVAGRSCGQAGS